MPSASTILSPSICYIPQSCHHNVQKLFKFSHLLIHPSILSTITQRVKVLNSFCSIIMSSESDSDIKLSLSSVDILSVSLVSSVYSSSIIFFKYFLFKVKVACSSDSLLSISAVLLLHFSYSVGNKVLTISRIE